MDISTKDLTGLSEEEAEAMDRITRLMYDKLKPFHSMIATEETRKCMSNAVKGALDSAMQEGKMPSGYGTPTVTPTDEPGQYDIQIPCSQQVARFLEDRMGWVRRVEDGTTWLSPPPISKMIPDPPGAYIKRVLDTQASISKGLDEHYEDMMAKIASEMDERSGNLGSPDERRPRMDMQSPFVKIPGPTVEDGNEEPAGTWVNALNVDKMIPTKRGVRVVLMDGRQVESTGTTERNLVVALAKAVRDTPNTSWAMQALEKAPTQEIPQAIAEEYQAELRISEVGREITQFVLERVALTSRNRESLGLTIGGIRAYCHNRGVTVPEQLLMDEIDRLEMARMARADAWLDAPPAREDDGWVDDIRARCFAATAGPWVNMDGGLYGEIRSVDEDMQGATLIAEMPEGDDRPEDFEFIANAREDVPALLAEIDRLKEYLGPYGSPVMVVDDGSRIDCVSVSGGGDSTDDKPNTVGLVVTDAEGNETQASYALVENIPSLKFWRRKAYQLFRLLDEIDTASDKCRGDAECYAKRVGKLHVLRHEVLDEEATTKLYAEHYPKCSTCNDGGAPEEGDELMVGTECPDCEGTGLPGGVAPKPLE